MLCRHAIFPPKVSTIQTADLELIIGDGVSCADPGDGSLTGDVTVEDTTTTGEDGGLWGEIVVPEVAMPAGTHSLKLCVRGGVGIDVDSIAFDLVSDGEERPGGRGRAIVGKGSRSVSVRFVHTGACFFCGYRFRGCCRSFSWFELPVGFAALLVFCRARSDCIVPCDAFYCRKSSGCVKRSGTELRAFVVS